MGFESQKSFIEYIKNKKICDVGSGGGKFAKEVTGRHLPVKVVSVNPRLGDEYFREMERDTTQRMPHIDFKDYTQDELKAIQKAHDSTAVAAVAQALPFVDNAFDMLFDCNAVAFHTRNPEHFKAAIQEFLRVVRPNGVIRMNMLTDSNDPGLPPQWQINILDELKIKHQATVNPNLPSETIIEIVKPLT